MRFLISGASGFVGRTLKTSLEASGHEVTALVRDPELPGIYWEPNEDWLGKPGEVDHSVLEGFDAVFNLSGENISAHKWSTAQKQEILDSRVKSTRLLSRNFANLRNPPSVFLSASAVGYYGSDVRVPVDESGSKGEGFLADVCAAWEDAANECSTSRTRVVIPRLGIVLGPDGGMVGKILLPFKFGLGARIGDGSQWISWISLHDVVRAFVHCVYNPQIQGPVNFVAPEPVTNTQFSKALGEAVSRPVFLAIPRPFLNFALGEMAEETALASQRALPKRLVETGFQFIDSTVDSALRSSVQ